MADASSVQRAPPVGATISAARASNRVKRVPEDGMVMLRTGEPVTYVLYDDEGRAVGRILLPREESLVGPRAGTVLLRRDPPRSQETRSRPQAA
jgi:hypothetical protein